MHIILNVDFFQIVTVRKADNIDDSEDDEVATASLDSQLLLMHLV